jgi:hypothetical protein
MPRPARSSPSSAPTAPARPRCCVRWPGCCRSTGSLLGGRVVEDPTPGCGCRPSSGTSGSCSSSTCCSPTSRPSRTSRSGCVPAASRAARHGRGPGTGWHGSGSTTTPRPSPARCRAGRPSGSRSPGRWPPTRPAAARRTAGRARRRHPPVVRRSCAATSTPSPARRCSSPTSRSRRSRLADRLVILEAGRVVQDDPPAVVARRPRSAWAARLVGLNHYRGHADGHTLTLDSGAALTAADAADPR